MKHKLDICMLVHNRPRLTRQAIESLIANTMASYRLTIVDDNSAPETAMLLDEYQSENCHVFHSRYVTMGPGLARNVAISKADKWGRGELLYLADNDCFFLPNWAQVLLNAWEALKHRFKGPLAIGGYAHPFQQRGRLLRPSSEIAGRSVKELEALGLLSWLMAWETWDWMGPFELAVRVNGSEDWLMSQKIRKVGGKVAVVEPQVVVNCGITSSDGKLCPGASQLWNQEIPEGVVLE